MIKILITARENIFGYKRTKEEEIRECKELIKQIKRHVDDIGSIDIEDDEQGKE